MFVHIRWGTKWDRGVEGDRESWGGGGSELSHLSDSCAGCHSAEWTICVNGVMQRGRTMRCGVTHLLLLTAAHQPAVKHSVAFYSMNTQEGSSWSEWVSEWVNSNVETQVNDEVLATEWWENVHCSTIAVVFQLLRLHIEGQTTVRRSPVSVVTTVVRTLCHTQGD